MKGKKRGKGYFDSQYKLQEGDEKFGRRQKIVQGIFRWK